MPPLPQRFYQRRVRVRKDEFVAARGERIRHESPAELSGAQDNDLFHCFAPHVDFRLLCVLRHDPMIAHSRRRSNRHFQPAQLLTRYPVAMPPALQ